MVNQSRPHLLRDLNPEPEEKASELLRDLTANDTYMYISIVNMLFVSYVC
jgi:hypothetical protein